jgi:hypothetical protein|tara:strand:+ start:283 stop:1257 length:975 start_codon:yes stop_codon:yes gene_type:complete
MKPKVVITGGCSYSQIKNADETWPKFLLDTLEPEHVGHLGQGAAGNEYISRSVISTVQLALDEGHKPEEILVGVVWSGCDRQLYYSDNADTSNQARRQEMIGWGEFIQNNLHYLDSFPHLARLITFADYLDRFKSGANPYSSSPMTIRNSKNMGFYTLNSHWEDELTIGYYRKYMNPAYAIMQTCEHILRTQWFLKSHNIPYFMSEYDFDVFTYVGPHRPAIEKGIYSLDDPGISKLHWMGGSHTDKLLQEEIDIKDTHPEVSYLYNMIDRDYWLPVRDLKNWTLEESPYEQRDPKDPHPSSEQQEDFTKRVILPFILEKYNIS